MSSDFNYNLPYCHSTPIAKRRERPNNLSLSKYGWYRVLVYSLSHDSGDSMEGLLDELHSASQCAAIPWKPYYLHKGGDPDEPSEAKVKFTFYVRHLSLALVLQNTRLPGVQNLRVRANNRLPKVHLDHNYKRHLRLALSSRFDAAEQCLDLSCFHCDAQFKDHFCALAQNDCLRAVIAEIKQCIPLLHSLVLNSNYLKDLSAFQGVERYQPQLQSISLMDNELTDLEALRVFAELPIKQLNLRRNPFNFELPNLCELLPTLCVLDGRSIRHVSECSKKANILNREICLAPLKSTATELPTFKTVYLVDSLAYADLKRFLTEYLSIFDASIERSALAGFYHKNAVVSLSTAKDTFAGWLEPYTVFDNNRISKRASVFELEASRAVALAMFSFWPRTQHLLETITVDLLVRQRERVCFTITGLFEEHIPLSAQPPLFRYFMRSFLLVPLASSCPPDFRIANEVIFLCAANRAQLQLLQSTPLTNCAHSQHAAKRPLPRHSKKQQQLRS